MAQKVKTVMILPWCQKELIVQLVVGRGEQLLLVLVWVVERGEDEVVGRVGQGRVDGAVGLPHVVLATFDWLSIVSGSSSLSDGLDHIVLSVTVSGGALALTHSPLSSLTSLLQMQTLLLLRSILWYRAPYSADHFNSLSLIFLPKELQVSEIDDKQVLLECEQTANRWLLLKMKFFRTGCCLLSWLFLCLHFVCLL